ncbi:cation:proton antiporter domain-containing protein [Entomomonas asaccharolytica]|uniref:Cation:proton antiporter n=1 Tax=Entomomonas asaccharolytica TaxID=2785331 RepID=A0A974NDX6_9GAMM|nr:cation:proton antiporter [Entomomonas asaccharolytica]QQP84602.1 cation:proton antiporter [Entomomonas asaccharolytica]
METPLIATISVGFVLALILGAIAHRLRISPLVGYLIAGICVGPYTPFFVADGHLSHEISEIGVILLMFGVGLHFSLKDLMSVKNIAIPGAIAQITLATLMGMGLAWLIGWNFGTGLIFGLALSVASTVVLLRALESRQLIDSRRGKIAVGWLIVEDLVMVLALVLLPALAGVLGGSAGDIAADAAHNQDLADAAITAVADTSPAQMGIVMQLLITLGKVAAFIALMILVGRKVIPWVLERVAGMGSRELFTLSVLAIAMGIAFGSAELFGVSFALGAFFAGMVLNESELSHKAAEDSLPFRDAFAVLFFVSVGMLFDPKVLVEQPVMVLATLLIIVIGKSIAAFVIVKAFGKPTHTALTISASLAQIGEFSFILAGLGMTYHILPKEGYDLVLAGAILSILINPILFVLLDRFYATADKKEAAVTATSTETTDTTTTDLGSDAVPQAAVAEEESDDIQPITETQHAIIVGYGRVGVLTSQYLHEKGVPFVIIEDAHVRVDSARELGYTVVEGNAANINILQRANIEQAQWLLIAVPNGFEAGQIAEHARNCNASLDIMARAQTEAEQIHLEEHGSNFVVIGEREIARLMESRLLKSVSEQQINI